MIKYLVQIYVELTDDSKSDIAVIGEFIADRAQSLVGTGGITEITYQDVKELS